MITKKVSMNNASKSSFSGLINYLTDTQNKLERVGDITISNCNSEEVKWAELEIAATQKQNTRATSDKTYHMIISFREGENPPKEVLQAIEQELCEGLGFGEHQRISVVHNDTENLHIHVAINKIHPTKLTLLEPYRDHYIRDKLCATLEKKYGLEVDNHKSTKTQSENKAQNMERMAGVETLLGFVRKFTSEIEAVNNWQDLHELLADNGVALKQRANGLVFQSGDVFVKASTVDRHFSKNALEKRLGEYEHSQVEVNTDGYQPEPIYKDQNSKALFQEYLAWLEQNTYERKSGFASTKNEFTDQLERLKASAKLKRSLIKLGTKGSGRKMALKLVSSNLRRDIQKLASTSQKKRQAIFSTTKNATWKYWLKMKAQSGDSRVIEALSKVKPKPKGNIFINRLKRRNKPLSERFINAVTSKGTLVYKVANTAIRENANGLSISESATDRGMEAALILATHRYGKYIDLGGSDEFKTKVARIAALKNIEVTFTDKQLEQLKTEFKLNPEMEIQSNDQNSRRSSSRGYAGQTGRGREQRTVGRGEQPRSTHKQPHSTKYRRFSKTDRIFSLSEMPSLSLVRHRPRNQMFLSGDANADMEQQRTKRTDGLRRPISGMNQSLSNVDLYIKERNDKREKIFDIPLHRRYTESDDGQLLFNGLRSKNGTQLVLLKQKGKAEILVKEIDAKTAARLRSKKLGTIVEVHQNKVVVKVKGLSR